jgi:addiction module RelE/StbE family toxin
MKAVTRSPQFRQNFKKRVRFHSRRHQEFLESLEQFIKGNRAELKDHALHGSMSGFRSFSVAPDLRVVYLELDERIVLLDIGAHKEVYRK